MDPSKKNCLASQIIYCYLTICKDYYHTGKQYNIAYETNCFELNLPKVNEKGSIHQ
jgi:hypothetical protein